MARYRSYDHRIKQMISESKNPALFPALNIPMSTALGWIKKGIQNIVTLAELDQSQAELILENQNLKRDLQALKASHDLSLFTFKLFGLQIQYRRLPFQEAKSMLLSAIEGAREVLSLNACLAAIGLRAHAKITSRFGIASWGYL